MNPVDFPESNCRFGPPEGVSESQVCTIDAYRATIERGSMEGAEIAVVAWEPTDEERARIASGLPVYITFIGMLPPHYPSTDFYSATHPA